MNFLTPIVCPRFEKFYEKFDHIFSEPAQRHNFRLYGTGLMLAIKRKNIWYINEQIIASDYQPMHHFMRDAPWSENSLKHQRTDMLANNPATQSCDDGYTIIDDTGNPKSGEATFATQRQWLGSLGKVACGQVVVTSHYADARQDWPIDHRPYLPKKWVEAENTPLGKEVYVFKSKLELVDELLKRGIQFSHRLLDSWSGNSPDFINGVERRECLVAFTRTFRMVVKATKRMSLPNVPVC